MDNDKKVFDNILFAEGFKIGTCKTSNGTKFAISFIGEAENCEQKQEYVSIIPLEGLKEIISGLFRIGVDYQNETGVDIGFGPKRGDEPDEK